MREGRNLELALSVDEADRIFLRALEAVGIPTVRRYMIATAAIVASRWRRGGVSRWSLGFWFVLMTAALVAGVYGIATANPWPVTAALLIPFPASLLWGWRRTLLGLAAGATWPLIYLPGYAAISASFLYIVLERLVRFLTLIRPQNRGRAG